jgi:hypothetical protein
MKGRKAVTAKKVEANRRNAKRSTGPQTDRGKLAARLNAVTLGLFAKHVVIPVCDGHGSDKEFRRLLDDLQQEFLPLGIFEEWWLVKIAESMWRLRRATRSEKGCVRETAFWGDVLPENDRLTDVFRKEVAVLSEAEEQIRAKGTLSQRTYAQVLPKVEEERLQGAQVEEGNRPTETKIDDEFMSFVEKRREVFECIVEGSARLASDRYSDHLAYHSLPPEELMDKVLRYESRIQKQLDWALQKLLECQQRRQSTSASRSK